MSFGGSVQSMITSLKNNSRSRRKSYFDRGGLYSKTKKKRPFFKKKATPEELAKIREKMLYQRKENRFRLLLIVLLSVIFLVGLLWFLNSFTFEDIKGIFA